MPAIVFSAIAVGLLVLATPIFLAIITATFISFELFAPPIPSMVLPQRMIDGVNRFSLVAIPLFIYAADVISRGQIGTRLVALTEALMGHLTGGVAIATAGACAIFGAMSGVGPAAVVSIGPIVYPSLVRQGYSKRFAVGLILTASTLAMLVPPGIAMILYAIETNNSVGSMFIAGLSTGALFTLVLAGYSYAYAKIRGIGRMPKTSWAMRWQALRRAGWALGLPAIVLGGIYSGAATPTEAAAFACVYAIFVETLIYRQLKLRDMFRVSKASAQTVAVLMILIAAGTVMTYFMTLMQYPAQISQAIGGVPTVALLAMINVTFLIAGMFVDPNSAIIVLAPLVYQSAMAAGIDPIHLGAVVVVNVAIGMVTPPFGLNLFVGMTTFRIGYVEAVKGVAPFLLLMVLVLGLVTYIPGIALLFL